MDDHAVDLRRVYRLSKKFVEVAKANDYDDMEILKASTLILARAGVQPEKAEKMVAKMVEILELWKIRNQLAPENPWH